MEGPLLESSLPPSGPALPYLIWNQPSSSQPVGKMGREREGEREAKENEWNAHIISGPAPDSSRASEPVRQTDRHSASRHRGRIVSFKVLLVPFPCSVVGSTSPPSLIFPMMLNFSFRDLDHVFAMSVLAAELQVATLIGAQQACLMCHCIA